MVVVAMRESKFKASFSLSEIKRPKRLVSRKVRINGLSFDIGSPRNARPLPPRIKSLI